MKHQLATMLLTALLCAIAAPGKAEGATHSVYNRTIDGGTVKIYGAVPTSDPAPAEITEAEEGSTVYLVAEPAAFHTTKGLQLRVVMNAKSSVAESRSRALGYAEEITPTLDAAGGYYTFTMPDGGWDAAIYATFPKRVQTVTYLDPTKPAGQQECEVEAYILDTPVEELVGSEEGTWYVCTGDVTYETSVTFSGNVHLILADGKTMTVTGPDDDDAIHGETGSSLTIYGQSLGTGALVASGDNFGIFTNGSFTLNGGRITATGFKGIAADGEITINGGVLNATGSYIGVNCYQGFTFNGGKVVAIGSSSRGIFSNGRNIVLGWTNPDDYIYASGYVPGSGTVSTAAGKRFVAYSVDDITAQSPVETAREIIPAGSITELTATPARMLRPIDGYLVAMPTGVNIVGDGSFTITTGEGDETVVTRYGIYKASTEEAPVNVTIARDVTYITKISGLPEGTAFQAVNGQDLQRTFAMPAQDVTLTPTAVTGLTASGTLTYSGSAQTPSISLGESAFETTNYTVTGITPKEGSNSQLTDGSAVNAGEYSIAITGLGQYIGTTSVDFTIGKADYDGTTTVSTYVRSGQVTTGKTLTLPDLPDGASYAANGTAGGVTPALIDGTRTPTVSGTTLTFNTTSQDDNTSATITIGVTGATNYNDYNVVVTVTAVNKDEAVVTFMESNNLTKTYGDADFALQASVPAAAGSGGWTWTSSDTDVATIGETTGTVTIKKTGNTTIKAIFESDTHLGEAEIALTVDAKTLGITWITNEIVYDGTPKAPTATLSGVKSGDECTVSISVEGDHTAVSTGYTATATLSGIAAGNYTLPENKKSQEFSISPKPVTVSGTGVTANNKVYDGTTSATLSGSFAFDDGMIIDGDNVTITGGTGAFANKNVGTGKTVVISGVTLGGTDAGNYTLSAQPTGVTGSITKKTVTVTSGITASNKTYDGTTSATLSGSSAVISGKVTGDVLGVSASGTFANKSVGTGKTVNISSISLTGSDNGNYVLASSGNQTTTTANISKKALTVTADDKSVSYGAPAPNYTASYSGFVSGESKSNLSGSLSFSCSYTSGSNTGTYTITPSGHTSSNYSISYAAGTLTVAEATITYSSGTITQDEQGYSVSLTEEGGSGIPLPVSGTVADLDYSRTLTAPGSSPGDVTIGGDGANLYTVCLPFSPDTGTGVTYYTLNKVEGTTLSFEEISGSPAAFTPYLVAVKGNSYFTEDCSNVSFETSTAIISTTANGYTFTGTLTGLTNNQALGKYILQTGNKWGKVTASKSGAHIPPFRAYIEGPANGARMLTGHFDGDATSIQYIRTTDADGTEQWYDLQGRPIAKPATKGIYIHNGRKEVLK